MAPYGGVTGGVELAHQLVDRLRDRGCNAYIVYSHWETQEISIRQDVTRQYEMYNIRTTKEIVDDESNILILPEIFFEFVLMYNRIQIGCWWMSVDNRYKVCSFGDKFVFEKSNCRRARLLFNYLFRGMYRDIKNNDALLKKKGDRILHLYQSHYAQYHLYSKGFGKILPLSDYINVELIGTIKEKRKDIVLYNPLKGIDFTNKIIKKLPDVKFVPLRGLSRDELRTLLNTAKLYIDFGHFPGKDRLPREAAINGCCVITGTLGSSYFYEDVPIDKNYKFERSSVNLQIIVDKIKYVLKNYELCYHDFDIYRERIKNEKDVFYQEIDKLFGLHS